MNTGLAFLVSWALALAGMAALALAMDRHHEQLTGARTLPRHRAAWLQLLGGLLLAAALVPCVQTWGASVGPLAWLGCMSAGALAVTWGLSWASRGLACLAVVVAVVAAPVALFAWLYRL